MYAKVQVGNCALGKDGRGPDLGHWLTAADVAHSLDHAWRCLQEDLLECPNFSDVFGARLAGRTPADIRAH